ELLEPLFVGTLLAHGRRTATTWFRAGDFAAEFRRGYTLLGTLGRSCCDAFASILCNRLQSTIDPGPFWLFALDDTPTQRYGPEVEGAGIHHNPTPGPAGQQHLYGHVWVTLGWIVRHPECHTLALPLLADLYIRRTDLPKIDADRRPEFHTKLESAAAQLHWLAEHFRGSDKPIWAVAGGARGRDHLRRSLTAERGPVQPATGSARGRTWARPAAALWHAATEPGQAGGACPGLAGGRVLAVSTTTDQAGENLPGHLATGRWR